MISLNQKNNPTCPPLAGLIEIAFPSLIILLYHNFQICLFAEWNYAVDKKRGGLAPPMKHTSLATNSFYRSSWQLLPRLQDRRPRPLCVAQEPRKKQWLLWWRQHLPSAWVCHTNQHSSPLQSTFHHAFQPLLFSSCWLLTYHKLHIYTSPTPLVDQNHILCYYMHL